MWLWGLGSPKVAGNVIIRYSAHDFLFDFNGNYASILYRFRVIASYLSEVAYFNLSHLHLAPTVEVSPFEFPYDFSHRKQNYRSRAITCFLCMISCLAALTQYRCVTDTDT